MVGPSLPTGRFHPYMKPHKLAAIACHGQSPPCSFCHGSPHPPTHILNKICGCFKTCIFVALRCLSAPRTLGQLQTWTSSPAEDSIRWTAKTEYLPADSTAWARRHYYIYTAIFLQLQWLPRYAGRFARGPSRRLSHRTRGYMERHQPQTGAFPVYPFCRSLSCYRHDGIHFHAAIYSVIITASRSWPGTASASLSGISKNILPVFVGRTDTYTCILPLSWNFRRMFAYRLENYWQSPIPAGIFNMVF